MSALGGCSTSLVRGIRDRAMTGKGQGTKLRAEDLSVSRQRFEYLQLPTTTTKSTIAIAFSCDGYEQK